MMTYETITGSKYVGIDDETWTYEGITYVKLYLTANHKSYVVIPDSMIVACKVVPHAE